MGQTIGDKAYELEFELERDDLVAYTRYVLANSRGKKLLWYALWGLAGFIAGLVLTTVIASVDRLLGGEPPQPVYRPYVFGVVVGTAVMLYLARTAWKKNLDYIADTWTGKKDTPRLGPRRMTLSREGFTFVGPEREHVRPWQSVTNVVVLDDRAFLVADLVFVVPCRAFADRSGFEEFLAAAHNWRSPQERQGN